MKKSKLKLVAGLILGIIMIILQGILSQMIDSLLPEGKMQIIVSGGVSRIIVSIIILLIAKKIYNIRFTPSTKGMKNGIFIYGATMWIAAIVFMLAEPFEFNVSTSTLVVNMLVEFIVMMSVGMFEESLCRGLLFNACKDYFGESKKQIAASMIISSAFFGLIHFANWSREPHVFVISQVIYAIFFGCLFAIIYYRTKNIWPCIILHGIVDTIGFVGNCFKAPINTSVDLNGVPNTSLLASIMYVVVCIPMFIAAIILLNKHFKNKKVCWGAQEL